MQRDVIMSRYAWLMLVLVLAVAALPCAAQRNAGVPNPDPEEERKSFQVAEGFEVNLFAADPLLAKPIQMSFDARGRLWVATSETYPQIKPGEETKDKIIVLEDKDGDGRADKTTVFADGLLIPTGIEPGDGGVYVADSTDLVHLADTDGDGKADRRRVVLSGFGTEDTHHIIHAFRWGVDGALYFNQSIYIHSHIETPHGVRRLNAGGVWQLRPESLKLEVFLRGFCNPWGHHQDRWGQSFVTDGAYGEGINWGLPGASYVFAQPAVRILPGLNPGSPKHCGLEIVSGRRLPPDWQGNMLTHDFRGHRVCRFVVSEDGAGYASREQKELIKTSHGAFRPVDVKMGPDGAIYIADWYNPIIQHGEVDFRDPRRDRTHGRIWRVTAKGRPLVPRPQLAEAPVEQVLAALAAPEDWTRGMARRVLKERGRAAVEPALAAWVAGRKGGDEEGEHQLLEGLWVYQGLDVVEPKLLGRLLNSPEPRARAAAVRVAGEWSGRLDHPLDLLAARVRDEHPRVRLEAVRALARVPGVRAAEVALEALDKPVDRWLDYALWLTARETEAAWLPEVQKGQVVFGGNVGHLVYALQAVGSTAAVKPLAELVRSGRVPPGREEGVLSAVARLGGPAELGLVLRGLAGDDKVPAGRRAALLEALVQASRERGVRPDGDLGLVAKLLDAGDEPVRAAAARAAGQWGVAAARPRLTELAKAPATPDVVRQAALDGLAALGGPESRATLEELSAPGRPTAWRAKAVAALAAVNAPAAAARAAQVLGSAEAGADLTEMVGVFLNRKNGAEMLAQALAGTKVAPDVARLALRAVRTSAREAPALAEALTKASGLESAKRGATPEEVQKMVRLAAAGDPARGEAVFRRADMVCLKCHAIGGSGGQVGPDLVSLGASAPVDYLVESLLAPNKKIKENYHSLQVETSDGRLWTGIKVRETKAELVLRDIEDREVPIPLKKIDSQRTGGSLMPEGLIDPLTDGEVADLVRFLSELGKVGPYAVGPARVARRWQVLAATPEATGVLARTGFAAAAGDEPALVWSPAYTTVAGELPVAELPVLTVPAAAGTGSSRRAFARCQLDVSTPGKVKLAADPAGLSAWLDGRPVDLAGVVELAPGLHTLTVAVDPAARRPGLRLELEDAAGSPARARFVTGK